jgi:hypothetical protein
MIFPDLESAKRIGPEGATGLFALVPFRFGLGTFHAMAEFVDTLLAVQSSADFAFGHDFGLIASVFLAASWTNKYRITHFHTSLCGPRRQTHDLNSESSY